MEKWLKYSLISLVILLLIGTSWFTYTFFIKDYETADKNVDNIVDTDFEVELPVGLDSGLAKNENGSTEKNVNKSKNKNEPSKKENSQGKKKEKSTSNPEQRDTENEDDSNSTNTRAPTEESNKENENQTSDHKESTNEDDNGNLADNNSSDESENSEEESEKTQQDHITAEDIKNRYRPTFQALQDQALAKLNNLVAYAYSEYKKKKENGEKVSYGYFYKKYKSAAKELEAKTDATFERLYTSLQQDLVENGFSKQEASDVKAYYNQKKDERESQMLSKVLDKF